MPSYSPENAIPVEAANVNKQLLDAFLAKDAEAVKSLSDPVIWEAAGMEGQLPKIFELIPDETSGQAELVFAEIRRSDNSENSYPIYLSQYEIAIGDKFLLMSLFVNERDGCCLFQHFKMNTSDERPSTQNKLTLQGKTFAHYVFAGLLIAVPLFIIFTIVSCIRNENLKLKWLWVLFVSIGVYGVTFNWSTGEIGTLFYSITQDPTSGESRYYFSLFSFNVLGASITKNTVVASWIVSIGIPLGAIIYWIRHNPWAVKKSNSSE